MSAPVSPVKPEGTLIDHTPWYRCPACGSERGSKDGLQGEKGDVIFADGRQKKGGAFHLQAHTWRLTCPSCGHRWVVEVVWTNVDGTRRFQHPIEAWEGYIEAKHAYADYRKAQAAQERAAKAGAS